MSFLTISPTARRLDRSTATVRAWAAKKILPSIRTASGIRLFDEQDVMALAATLERARKGTKR